MVTLEGLMGEVTVMEDDGGERARSEAKRSEAKRASLVSE